MNSISALCESIFKIQITFEFTLVLKYLLSGQTCDVLRKTSRGPGFTAEVLPRGRKGSVVRCASFAELFERGGTLAIP